MALWKESATPKKDVSTMTPEPALRPEPDFSASVSPVSSGPRRVISRETRESVIAADITIEGKIDGTGHVRLAGRFKGDVNIQGDLTVEAGAKLTGPWMYARRATRVGGSAIALPERIASGAQTSTSSVRIRFGIEGMSFPL